MRALVIGGDGTLGRALHAALLGRGDEAAATTRSLQRAEAEGRPLLDLAAPDVAALPQADVAFLCAAVTGYAVCRRAPDLARRINVENTAALGRDLVARGTRLVYLSTSAVFDGRLPQRRAEDAPAPISEYGGSKAAAEAALGALGPAVAVVRLTKVLPPAFALFDGWCEALTRQAAVEAFEDMRFAPVSLSYAVEAVTAVAESGEAGLFQVSASRDITYLEAARHLAERLSAPAGLVRAGSAAARGIPQEERPPFTGLDTRRLDALTGSPAPDPFGVIDGWLHSRMATASRRALRA